MSSIEEQKCLEFIICNGINLLFLHLIVSNQNWKEQRSHQVRTVISIKFDILLLVSLHWNVQGFKFKLTADVILINTPLSHDWNLETTNFGCSKFYILTFAFLIDKQSRKFSKKQFSSKIIFEFDRIKFYSNFSSS